MTMRLLLAALTAVLLSLAYSAEDYQCGADAGCVGRITEDGELHEVTFRKGDMVSTDANWTVSTDDGWVKVKTHGRGGGTRGIPKFGVTIGEVVLWTPAAEVFTGTLAVKAPAAHAQFLRPAVSLLAEAPLEICLIGLR